MSQFRKILVPVDGSDTSRKALDTALRVARDDQGSIRIVHCVDELAYLSGFEASSQVFAAVREGAERVLSDAAAVVRDAGVPHETQLIDQPGQRLGKSIADEAAAWQADLIVVGTHGRRGFERAILGSGAEQILRAANAPVLVVRGSEAAA